MKDAVKELFAAMAKAFPKIEGAIKGKTNPAFRSKYADLAAVIDAIKPALSEHGLFFMQLTHEVAGGVCVETAICHESGEHTTAGKLYVPATKQDAQGYGSALSYARRYSLMTAFGVPAEDDDGNAAARPAPATQAVAPPAPAPADPLLLAAAREAAMGGTNAFRVYWATVPQEYRRMLREHIPALQAAAKAADEVGAME